MKIRFDLFKREVNLTIKKGNSLFYIRKLPQMNTGGITSRCMDLKHVLFLDYDNIERWIVEDELRLLQLYFQLSPFYLFTTKEEINEVSGNLCGNYHAICLTKMPIQEVSIIQDQTHIDWKYKGMFRISRYKSWVLRAAPKGNKDKPKYIGIIGDKVWLDNEVSEAHLKLLQELYDIDDLEYERLDGLNETIITTYKTGVGGNA